MIHPFESSQYSRHPSPLRTPRQRRDDAAEREAQDLADTSGVDELEKADGVKEDAE